MNGRLQSSSFGSDCVSYNVAGAVFLVPGKMDHMIMC